MENAIEVMEQLHEHMIQSKNSGQYIEAAVTCSLTVGFAGANLEGWITYNDERYGKVHFKSGIITEHSWFFAGGGALPSFQVLIPKKIADKGRFEATGSLGGGALMLWSADGAQVFEIPFPVVGAGAPYWSAKGEVDFTHTK